MLIDLSSDKRGKLKLVPERSIRETPEAQGKKTQPGGLQKRIPPPGDTQPRHRNRPFLKGVKETYVLVVGQRRICLEDKPDRATEI